MNAITIIANFFIFGVAGYALVAYSVIPLGSLVHPMMRAAFQSHQVIIYLHVFPSVIALILGPLQLWPKLRTNWPHLHRWLGRIYLGIGVGIGGLAGLMMSQYAFGGALAQTGFAVLAVLWLFTGIAAFQSILKMDIASHRRWMTRNYSLTFAAVTLRVYITISLLSGLAFEDSYPFIAWLCWIPNLIAAEIKNVLDAGAANLNIGGEGRSGQTQRAA